MTTKFPKITDSSFPPRWARFYHAGTEWVQAYELLKAENKKIHGLWLPYVHSFALGFATELFVKSIVAHRNPAFDPKGYKHNTTSIITEYANSIPMFDNISKNIKLMDLLKAYENTIDTKFGDTLISIEADDEQIALDNIYTLRALISEKTGLR